MKRKKEEDLQVCIVVQIIIYLNYSIQQKKNEMIAHLKDQLQEMKAKTGLEAKYVKKEAQVILLVMHVFRSRYERGRIGYICIPPKVC